MTSRGFGTIPGLPAAQLVEIRAIFTKQKPGFEGVVATLGSMATSAERMRRMRERRREGLQPDPGAPLRDADELVAPALEAALAALDLQPEDAAVIALARAYARTLDTARDPAWAARWIGPLYLTALEALHGTPMARAKLKKDPSRAAGPSWLDQMRAARVRDGHPLP